MYILNTRATTEKLEPSVYLESALVLATTFFQSSARENGREGKSIEKWFGLQEEDLPCQPVKHSFIEVPLFHKGASIQLKCEFVCLLD